MSLHLLSALFVGMASLTRISEDILHPQEYMVAPVHHQLIWSCWQAGHLQLCLLVEVRVYKHSCIMYTTWPSNVNIGEELGIIEIHDCLYQHGVPPFTIVRISVGISGVCTLGCDYHLLLQHTEE